MQYLILRLPFLTFSGSYSTTGLTKELLLLQKKNSKEMVLRSKQGQWLWEYQIKRFPLKKLRMEGMYLRYGMVVWSTGIGTRPVIMDFMKQIGRVISQTYINWLFSFDLLSVICWFLILLSIEYPFFVPRLIDAHWQLMSGCG